MFEDSPDATNIMNAADATLLRPSRPLSTIDAVFANKSRTRAGGAVFVGTAVDATRGPPTGPSIYRAGRPWLHLKPAPNTRLLEGGAF